jgi:hypothetical protein
MHELKFIFVAFRPVMKQLNDQIDELKKHSPGEQIQLWLQVSAQS